MTASLSRSLGFGAFPSASIKIHADHLLPQSTSIPTLRRTLSADMSSKKWISQNTIKKVPSLENLHFQEDNEGGAFEEIWSSIQREKKEEEEEMAERPKQTADIWSSIISQKKNEDETKQGSVYVHPLVKRSASTLSEKSLEICTESLGSETGSDGFSFLEQEEELKHEATKETIENEEEEIRVSTIRCVSSIKKAASPSLTTRSFPPPLPSLAHRGEGSNVEMRSHRQDGRLVLEAVSVPTHACLKAERQDGRLLLLFSGSEPECSEPETDEEEEEVVLYDECDHQQGDAMQEDEEDDESEQEEDDEVATNGEIIYSSLGHKFLNLTRNSAPVWPRRLNKVVTTLDDDEEEEDGEEGYVEVGQAMMNPYVYSWRSKAGPAVVAVAKVKEHDEEMGINKLLKVDSHYGKVVEVVVDAKRAGKGGEDLVPLFLKGCNLQQKQQPAKTSSLFVWEPRCIAT